MSRLTQLILELCPGGVPNEKVGSLCRNISSSKKIKKTSYRSSGKYVIVDQGQDLVAGYTDDEDALVAHGEYVIFGEHTREVKYVDFPFAQGADGIKILKARSGVIPRYLYHALSALNIPNRGYNRHWTIVKDMMVPLPPLPVQEEIVRILDKFTALEAELEAELEARKKQYEYYDLLLTFGDTVHWKPLAEICVNHDSRRVPIKASERKPGPYPYYGASGVVDYVDDYLFDGDYLLISEDGANLVARVTPIAFSITGRTWVNNHAHVLEFENYATRRFAEIYLNSLDLGKYISTAAQPKLTQANLNRIDIPVPSLYEQERIVDILDRFDALVNDISQGLSAEIAARRKQYEYYRDKLLTFKEVGSR